nr:RNA-directed DNA polymerase, eukaryota [Tanacetum cinerariifolium]
MCVYVWRSVEDSRAIKEVNTYMHLLDHRPILLRDVIADYGATPFRLYHSWLTPNGFEQLVIHTWNSTILEDSNGMIQFKKKLNSLDALDNLQKAKIQWAIEGDENSKFFHGVINRKRASLAIRGVMVDGEWVDDPRYVKEEFCSHFATRFHAPSGIRNKINFLFPNQLSSDQAFELEKQFRDTIGPDLCLAVERFFDHGSFYRGCNSSFIALIHKVQDPMFVNDYRHISLIGSLYKVVTKILALRLPSIIAGLISDVQTAFLRSRQILDGPFVINELLSWCKHKKQHAMIFKVDFAKDYDSVGWDFLDDVLQSFGFGFKWRSWILSSLSSGMASVLINGSPTAEFKFHYKLKQGDPLAPYLFILVMESLHLSFFRVVDAGIFKGIKIDNSTMISYLFYTNDAVFVGVGVPNDLIVAAASTLGYSIMKTPFKYLGVTVGAIRRNFFNWAQDNDKKITWVKWPKWVWRYISHDNSLWYRVISAIHGPNIQKLSSFTYLIWSNILKEINILKDRGVDLIPIDLIGSSVLVNAEDRWFWDLNGNGVFCVIDVRNLLDESFLPKEATVTRWVKFVSIKINFLAWKVSLVRLPTRVNLMHRGIYVSSLPCPICSSHIEDTSHLLFSCTMAADVTRLVCRWWDLVWSPFGSYSEWISWFNSIRLGSNLKSMLEGVFYVTWWCLWNFRNRLLFAAQKSRKDVIFDDIVARSFSWCNARFRSSFSWDNWLQHHFLISL